MSSPISVRNESGVCVVTLADADAVEPLADDATCGERIIAYHERQARPESIEQATSPARQHEHQHDERQHRRLASRCLELGKTEAG